jgi:tetratricopeptide (TPR) repeat protein
LNEAGSGDGRRSAAFAHDTGKRAKARKSGGKRADRVPDPCLTGFFAVHYTGATLGISPNRSGARLRVRDKRGSDMLYRSTFARAVVLVLGLGMATTACGQYSISNIRALKAFKDANDLYKKQEYKGAVEGYESALAINPDFYGITYFFLGNSYDNLYKPARAGEAENDAYLQKAVENYTLATQKIKDTEPQAAQIRKLAYEYLIAAYTDKLKDFGKAEPIAKQMIDMDPNDPTNYSGLGKMYEDAGRYDEAEAMFTKATEIKPNDPSVWTALAGYENRQGHFDKTIAALQKRADIEPNNPESWQTIASYYYDEAFRDKTLAKDKQVAYVTAGLQAVDKALALNPDYFEALSYKNILLRMEANQIKDPAKQKELIAQADDLRAKAIEAQKKLNSATAEAGKKAGGSN